MTNAQPMKKFNQDGVMDVQQMSYDERLAHVMGHLSCTDLAYDVIVKENDQLEMYKEFVDKYNQFMIDNEFFGLTSTGDDAMK